MPTDTINNLREREQRSHAARLTISLPRDTHAALKIHAAQRQTTIREIVTDLVHKEIEQENA